MTITYRGVKDEALTYGELDENFRDLRQDTDLERVLVNGNVANLTIVVPQVITDVSFVGGSNVTEAFIATNNYTLQVGAASNAWTNVQIAATGSAANNWTNMQIAATGLAANNYAIEVGAASNAWSNVQIAATGLAANAYALSISTSSGSTSTSYTIEVGAASNNYTNTVGISVGAGANVYAIGVGAAANNWSNTKISNTSVTVAGGLKMTDIHLLSNVTIPLAATTGNVGQISWDGEYLYVCVATNQWKRTPILPW
jgi:hypothetical protein